MRVWEQCYYQLFLEPKFLWFEQNRRESAYSSAVDASPQPCWPPLCWTRDWGLTVSSFPSPLIKTMSLPSFRMDYPFCIRLRPIQPNNMYNICNCLFPAAAHFCRKKETFSYIFHSHRTSSIHSNAPWKGSRPDDCWDWDRSDRGFFPFVLLCTFTQYL